MSARILQVSWYGFAATLRHRWSSYATLAVLVGLLGGVAMGSIAAARRTQASFATFLASTNPSDLTLSGFSAPNLTKDLLRLPGVERVASANTSLNIFPLRSDGAAEFPPSFLAGQIAPMGSVDGEYFGQDRVAVTAGRLADPNRVDEFDATREAERLLGWHVGQTIQMGFFTNAQVSQPGFGSPRVRPQASVAMRLVGTIVLNNEVVLDAVDRYPAFLLFTPTATRPFDGGSYLATYGIKVRAGAADVSSVEREIIAALPKGTTYSFHVT